MITFIKILFMSNNKKENKKIYTLDCLPNLIGFNFIAVLNSNEEVKTTVKRDETGKHYFDEFKNTIGWKLI